MFSCKYFDFEWKGVFGFLSEKLDGVGPTGVMIFGNNLVFMAAV